MKKKVTKKKVVKKSVGTLYARGLKLQNMAYLTKMADLDKTTVGHILNRLLDSERSTSKENKPRQLPHRRK